ncbi:hypothetical protein V8C35DRAFT_84971 [Trichoderma chlorosporum]
MCIRQADLRPWETGPCFSVMFLFAGFWFWSANEAKSTKGRLGELGGPCLRRVGISPVLWLKGNISWSFWGGICFSFFLFLSSLPDPFGGIYWLATLFLINYLFFAYFLLAIFPMRISQEFTAIYKLDNHLSRILLEDAPINIRTKKKKKEKRAQSSLFCFITAPSALVTFSRTVLRPWLGTCLGVCECDRTGQAPDRC